jgi:hypothetical protein
MLTARVQRQAAAEVVQIIVKAQDHKVQAVMAAEVLEQT